MQVAETPQTSDGFIGDLISTILVPSYALDGVNGTIFNETDYTEAQKVGLLGDGCSQYHDDCTVSLFEVFRNTLILDLVLSSIIRGYQFYKS